MPSPFLMFVASVGAFVLVLLLAVVLATLLFGVPRQARQRGHGFASWFVLQILAINPVYALVAVAMLPDRAKARLRKEYAAELDAKLGPGRTAPADADAAVPERSVGDLPTFAPPGRSIGDDATV